MHATLDPQDARPLTSREIAKVLCGIIGTLPTHDPPALDILDTVLVMLAEGRHDLDELDLMVSRVAELKMPAITYCGMTWAAALGATVMGLRGWCKPNDVQTALLWISQNLDTILAMGVPTVSDTN